MIFQRKVKSSPVDFVVAGLGNPGTGYRMTRHNAGFMALDRLADKYSARLSRLRFQALTDDVKTQAGRILLLKPQTYMNLSGNSAKAALSYFKLPPEQLIVVYDDMSLPLGKLRIREKGSAGGHNGIKSIIASLKSDAFPRVKIGIGAPEFHETKDYVLSRFEEKEQAILLKVLDAAADAVEEILKNGVIAAAGRFNGEMFE